MVAISLENSYLSYKQFLSHCFVKFKLLTITFQLCRRVVDLQSSSTRGIYDGSVQVTNYTDVTRSNNNIRETAYTGASSLQRDVYCGSVDITDYYGVPVQQKAEHENANNENLYDGSLPVTEYDYAGLHVKNNQDSMNTPVEENTYDGAVDVTNYDNPTTMNLNPPVCLRTKKDPILQNLDDTKLYHRSLPVMSTNYHGIGVKHTSVPQLSDIHVRHSLHLERITSI